MTVRKLAKWVNESTIWSRLQRETTYSFTKCIDHYVGKNHICHAGGVA